MNMTRTGEAETSAAERAMAQDTRKMREQHAAEDRAAFASLPALPPDGVALFVEDLGAKKVHYDTLTIFVLAILGGVFISIGGLFATIVQAGSASIVGFGIAKMLGGFVFATGLILCVVAGAQLFTSEALLTIALASGRIKVGGMLRVWVIVWVGNLVGSIATAAIIFLSGQYTQGHGAVGEMALYYATAKANLPVTQAFFMAIMCNVLVCLGTWVGYAGRTVADKVLAILFPIGAFVAAGFEHVVANMYFVPLGLFIQWGAPDSFWHDVGHAAPSIPVDHYILNLGVVTIGNAIGGGVLIGLMYWLAYRRPGKLRH